MVRKTRDELVADLVLHDLAEIEDLAALYFKPPHCQDRELLLALARTYISFLDSIIADDGAIFDYVDEVQGRWEVVRNGGQFPLMDDCTGERQDAPYGTNEVPHLSAFLNAYISERGAGLSDERAETLTYIVRDFMEICGDKALTSYRRADATAFKNVLLRLPPNLSKSKELKGLTLSDAAQRADELGLQRQGAKTITKKWAALGSLFRHASHNYDGVKNYFVTGALKVSDGVAAADEKTPFTGHELKVLFNSDLPSPLVWLARLALYTGARANELCQLSGDHFKSHDGLHYIYFSPELRLKTGSSQSAVRAVPLHPKLVKHGVLDFVAKADGGLVFPNLTVHRTGRKSDATGKKFTYQLKKAGIKRSRLSFHSLRHNFKQAWDRTHSSAVETRERLMGHAISGVAGRYGSGYVGEANDMILLAARAELLSKVDFQLV
jgi:integrase